MKIISVVWFTQSNGQIIGIVYGKDEVTDEEKSYIGVCAAGMGEDEEKDKKYIAMHGTPFPVKAAKEAI